MKHISLFFTVIILCCFSIISKSETLAKGNKYLLSYTTHKDYIPVLANKASSAKQGTGYITATYSISGSAVPSWGWYGVIVLDDGGSNFADSQTDALSGYIYNVFVPDTYAAEFAGFTAYATCAVYTDVTSYYGSTNEYGEAEIDGVAVNSSVSIYVY
jgi:hypothetical protein